MSTLEDIKLKKVTVNIDGVEKELRFDLNAYANIEEHLCAPIPNAFSMLEAGSMKAMRAFLWAGLLHENKTLDIEEVGRLTSLEGIMEALSEAIEASMPKDDNE
jgi:hypothetical protein